MSLKPSELVERLCELDLTESEARAYLSVVKLGTCRVAEIALDAHLQRTEIYRVMPRLVSLDLVEDTIDRPKRYTATKIRQSIPELGKRIAGKIKASQKATEEIAAKLSAIRHSPQEEIENEVRVIYGGEAARVHLLDSVGHAKEHFWGMSGSTRPAHLSDKFWSRFIRELAKRRLQTRFIVNVTKENLRRIKRMASLIDVRHYEQIPVYLYGYDDRSVAVSLLEEPVTDPSNAAQIVVTYEPCVAAMRQFFDAVWRESVRFSVREHLLLGTHPASTDTRIIRGRDEFYAFADHYMDDAKEWIGDSLSTRDSPLRLLARFKEQYIRARDRGVRIQIICTLSKENAESVRSLAGLFEVRHKEQPIGFDITVIDKTDAIIHHIDPDTAEVVPSHSDYTMHITNKEGILHLERMFKQLWEESIPIEKALQEIEQKKNRQTT